MPAAPKFIARRTQVTIGSNDLDCVMRKVALTPEDTEIDTATFCSPGDREYGTTMWTLELDVLQSFGDGGATNDGLHDMLAPLEKSVAACTLMTDKAVTPATPAKPHFTFEVSVPTIPIIDAEIGEKSEFSLTFPVVGAIVKVES